MPAAEERGLSAWHGHHLDGVLGAITAKAIAGGYPHGTIIVAEQIDRLSREGHDKFRSWLKLIIGAGMRVYTCDDGKMIDAKSIEDDDLGSKITAMVKAEGAREVITRMRKRVIGGIRRNQTRRLATGRPDSKVHPKWLEYDASGQLQKIEDRCETINQIYTWAAAGQGVLTICQRLNDEGFRCWSARHWKPTTVRHLLTHPSVDGSFQQMEEGKPFGDRMRSFYPVVVDNDLIARARAQLASRKRLTGKPSEERFINVFGDTGRCSSCMGRMHVQKAKDAKSGKVYRFFRCYNAAHRAGCDRAVTFRYHDLAEAVLDRILHLAMDDRFFSRPDETRGLAVTVADLERSLELDRAKSTRLLDLMLNGDPDPVMIDMRAKLTASIAASEAALSQARKDLAAAEGAVDPAAHLERVREVRSLLNDPNPTIRMTAGDMIATAMSNVVTSVMFESEGEKRKATKSITVIIAGGIAAMRFDNEGNLIDQRDLGPYLDAQLRSGVVGSNPRWNANLDAILRRAA